MRRKKWKQREDKGTKKCSFHPREILHMFQMNGHVYMYMHWALLCRVKSCAMLPPNGETRKKVFHASRFSDISVELTPHHISPSTFTFKNFHSTTFTGIFHDQQLMVEIFPLTTTARDRRKDTCCGFRHSNCKKMRERRVDSPKLQRTVARKGAGAGRDGTNKKLEGTEGRTN